MSPAKHNSVFATPLVALCALAASCSPHRDLPLLEVENIQPAILEPGDLLRVTGQGFPVGAEAELTLAGTFHRPGKAPLTIRERLQGEVHDPLRIEYVAPASWVRSLGRGTFDGEARVAIPLPDQPFSIRGSTPARFDIVPEGRRLARRPPAEGEPSVVFGLGLEDARGTGLRITTVVDGRAAQQSGLQKGDVIREADGVRLLAIEDFAPSSDTSAALVVRRPGVPGLHAVSLRAPQSVAARTTAPWWLVCLIGLALGLFSPARLVLTHTACAAARAPSVGFRTHVLTIALMSATACCTLQSWSSSSASAWVVALAVLLSIACFRGSLPHALRDYAYLLTAVSTVLLLSGGHRIADIVEAQGAFPLDWWACRHLAALLAFGVFVHALQSIAGVSGTVFGRGYAAASSVLGAILFLGGWSGLDISDASTLGMLAASLCLSVKACLVYATSFMLASVPRAIRRTALVALTLALLTVATEFAFAPVWSYALLGFCAGVFLHWLRLSVKQDGHPQLLTAR